MNNYKNLTSVGITELNGQKVIALNYDEIDETGRVVKDNIRDSRVILKIPANKAILDAIAIVETYAENIINN